MANLAKCLYNDKWVKFTIQYGRYSNFIDFLKQNKIEFLSSMKLNFNEIPRSYHGNGNCDNLLTYLSNNVDNDVLIADFITYFFYNITKIQNRNGSKLIFYIIPNNDWTKQQVIISNVAPQIYISVDSTQIYCDDTTIYI